MKRESFLLCAPVLFLAGVGIWFWAFPPKINRDLEGPFRAVLMWQKVSPLTQQEKFERYDTKVKFRFAMRGTPILPRGFSYKPQGLQSSSPTGKQVTYTLAARNYRLVTERNGLRKAHVQNAFGVLQDFSYGSGEFLDATISAKAHRAPRDSKNFIAFDLIAQSWNLGVTQKPFLGVYALDLQTRKLQKWR